MRFFTIAQTPKLTLTRTKRKCVVNEIAEIITLYESTTKIEIGLPSILQGMKDKFYNFLGSLLVPKVCPV